MRAVVQRVTRAEVRVGERLTGKIGEGLVVLLGVHKNDCESDVAWMSEKLVHLRIFEDKAGLMNRSLLDTGGSMLVVSQFTLLGDCRKGRRPSFGPAAPPEHAEALYNHFVRKVTQMGIVTATGRFGAAMQVSLTNDGPVTMVLETPEQGQV